MTRKQRRLTLIGLAGIVLAVAAGLVLYALSDRIVFFNSPSDVLASRRPAAASGSAGWSPTAAWSRAPTAASVSSSPTARLRSRSPIAASFPTSSAKGRGSSPRAWCRATASLAADTVLAKHDERYMPREVVEALKKQGVWQEGAGTAAATVGPSTAQPTTATQ